MPGLDLQPLAGDLRPECAELLAERYARQRAREPLLPEVGDFEPHLPPAGWVAVRDGRAAAYLGGEVDGDVARVGFAGVAGSDAEALALCLAGCARTWETQRFALHVPAGDAALTDAFFRLAFGCQFAWAIRESEPAAPVDFGGVVRPGTQDDLDAAVDLELELHALQAAAPSWSGLPSADRDAVRAEWSSGWNDPAVCAYLVAERAGEVVGHVVLYHRPQGDLRVPPGNVDLAQLVTRPAARGTGVGSALVAHTLRLAHEQGYGSVTVDWRTVNPLAGAFWPGRGFRPQYLRLYRRVP
jgi:GNAT superfamily N-acetyltransferase